MGWLISTYNMSGIHSLEAAAKHWDEEKPWKNELSCWRPLDNRRATHKRLVKLSDDRGYECVLFSTALVTYYTNGEVQLVSHDSQSSHRFAWCVAPRGCKPISHRGEMYWEVLTPEGYRYYRPDKTKLYLKPATPGAWTVSGQIPAAPTEKVFDRAKGTATRRALKPYADWYKMTERLMGQPMSSPRSVFYKGDVRTLLDNPANMAFYLPLAKAGGSLIAVREAAYEITGARKEVPAPYDRLPKRA